MCHNSLVGKSPSVHILWHEFDSYQYLKKYLDESGSTGMMVAKNSPVVRVRALTRGESYESIVYR